MVRLLTSGVEVYLPKAAELFRLAEAVEERSPHQPEEVVVGLPRPVAGAVVSPGHVGLADLLDPESLPEEEAEEEHHRLFPVLGQERQAPKQTSGHLL